MDTTTIALDIAKTYFQAHGVDVHGKTIRETLQRHQQVIVSTYFNECGQLAETLSQSANRVEVSAALANMIFVILMEASERWHVGDKPPPTRFVPASIATARQSVFKPKPAPHLRRGGGRFATSKRLKSGICSPGSTQSKRKRL